jgi:hypothetical protein
MRANHQTTYASVENRGVLPVQSTLTAATLAAVETTGR